MMGNRTLPHVSEYDELVLYTCARRGIPTEDESTTTGRPASARTTLYDAWLYGSLALPPEVTSLPALRPGTAPPADIGGLPLVGHTRLTIHWQRYAEYLSSFYAGEPGLHHLQAILRDALAPEIMQLVESPPNAVRVRAWWVNDAPELDDVAWESIALGPCRRTRLSIVRGVPRASVPPLPLPAGRRLTVAFFDPGGRAPTPVREALEAPVPGVTVVSLDGADPRAALGEAARAGVEVVHVVADAWVPLGLEGLLDFPSGATLGPAELQQTLRGSRVAIVTLSAPAEPRVGRDGLPRVFHGFARFGRAMGDGLSVVAPLGPVGPSELTRFWRTFYARLAQSLDVEDAVVEATPSPLLAPFVLFLRHRLGRQFWQGTLDEQGELVQFGSSRDALPVSPAQASADLAASSDLLDAAVALRKRYAELGLSFPGGDLIDKEHDRQRALAAYLDAVLAHRSER
jgi:hypothetical protein